MKLESQSLQNTSVDEALHMFASKAMSAASPPCKTIDPLSTSYSVPTVSYYQGQVKVKRRKLDETHTVSKQIGSSDERAVDKTESSKAVEQKPPEKTTTEVTYNSQKLPKSKLENPGQTTPEHDPKVRKITFNKLIVYNVPELPRDVIRKTVARHASCVEQLISVTKHRQRDGVRRFDVRPVGRVNSTLEDLPKLK